MLSYSSYALHHPKKSRHNFLSFGLLSKYLSAPAHKHVAKPQIMRQPLYNGLLFPPMWNEQMWRSFSHRKKEYTNYSGAQPLAREEFVCSWIPSTVVQREGHQVLHIHTITVHKERFREWFRTRKLNGKVSLGISIGIKFLDGKEANMSERIPSFSS